MELRSRIRAFSALGRAQVLPQPPQAPEAREKGATGTRDGIDRSSNHELK